MRCVCWALLHFSVRVVRSQIVVLGRRDAMVVRERGRAPRVDFSAVERCQRPQNRPSTLKFADASRTEDRGSGPTQTTARDFGIQQISLIRPTDRRLNNIAFTWKAVPIRIATSLFIGQKS